MLKTGDWHRCTFHPRDGSSQSLDRQPQPQQHGSLSLQEPCRPPQPPQPQPLIRAHSALAQSPVLTGSHLSPPLHGPCSSIHCPSLAPCAPKAPHPPLASLPGRGTIPLGSSTQSSPRSQAQTWSGNLCPSPPRRTLCQISPTQSAAPPSLALCKLLLCNDKLPTPSAISSHIPSNSLGDTQPWPLRNSCRDFQKGTAVQTGLVTLICKALCKMNSQGLLIKNY